MLELGAPARARAALPPRISRARTRRAPTRSRARFVLLVRRALRQWKAPAPGTRAPSSRRSPAARASPRSTATFARILARARAPRGGPRHRPSALRPSGLLRPALPAHRRPALAQAEQRLSVGDWKEASERYRRGPGLDEHHTRLTLRPGCLRAAARRRSGGRCGATSSSRSPRIWRASNRPARWRPPARSSLRAWPRATRPRSSTRRPPGHVRRGPACAPST